MNDDRLTDAAVGAVNALRDIINAADNGFPYSPRELRTFSVELNELRDALEERGRDTGFPE